VEESKAWRLCSASCPDSMRQLPLADKPVAASIGVADIVAEMALVAVPAREAFEPSVNLLYLGDLLAQRWHWQVGKHHSKLPYHSFDKNGLRVLAAHYSLYSS
jgi:hypothetical protein